MQPCRITIINSDKTVRVDGVTITGLNFNLDNNIHALHFDYTTNRGHVEYTDPQQFANKKLTSAQELVDLGIPQILDVFDVAYKIYQEQEKIIDESKNDVQALRTKRNMLLRQSDGLVFKYLDNGKPVPQEYVVYRQLLRELPALYPDGNIDEWPIVPQVFSTKNFTV